MPSFRQVRSGALTVTAYRGDFKALLAFDLAQAASENLAGFTVQVKPPTGAPYYLLNDLRFQAPGNHSQDASQPANASINAPYQKCYWVHIPGMYHQGLQPPTGTYTYVVTPRYFDASGVMLPIDESLSVNVAADIAPFSKANVSTGFTRGFTQSQAFVNHFGKNALIAPKSHDLVFNTLQQSGSNAAGQPYTYLQEYQWLGFTARAQIFTLLDDVVRNGLSLDVFAYDLNEPDVISRMLAIAKSGRMRIVLDNSSEHHNVSRPKPEDEFEKEFRQVAGGRRAPIVRGHFGRYAHDKILIVKQGDKPLRVLTGATNFSVTGLYVNSNHVLVFDDPIVAAQYEAVFEMAYTGNAGRAAALMSPEDMQDFRFAGRGQIPMDVTFAPHDEPIASQILDRLVERIKSEDNAANQTGSVLFAVMGITDAGKAPNPVYDVLRDLHLDQRVFSYGISDEPGGIALYKPGSANGILVTGKPIATVLPWPFNQVRNITGAAAHQVHHKVVVVAFNQPNAMVACGSSNLALGGEQVNGDNLLMIYDQDVATVFAIEVIALVDHFSFLDRCQRGKGGQKGATPGANLSQAAVDAEVFLADNADWVSAYYAEDDLRCIERRLFSAAVAPPAGGPMLPPILSFGRNGGDTQASSPRTGRKKGAAATRTRKSGVSKGGKKNRGGTLRATPGRKKGAVKGRSRNANVRKGFRNRS